MVPLDLAAVRSNEVQRRHAYLLDARDLPLAGEPMQGSIHFDDVALAIGDRDADREGAKQRTVFFATFDEGLLCFLAPLHLHLERLVDVAQIRCSLLDAQ